MPAPYEFIDHTADLAMRVTGRDFAELLQSAMDGMIRLMASVDDLAPAHLATLQVEGDSREQVLVRALKELLFLQEDGWQPVSARCTTVSDTGAVLVVGTVCLDQVLERLESAVKAVTYHGMEIAEGENELVVEVVLDT